MDSRQAAVKYHESLEEQPVAQKVLRHLQHVDPSSEEFAGKASVLKELIEHHAGEGETFKMAMNAMSTEDLEERGKRIEQAKESFKFDLFLVR